MSKNKEKFKKALLNRGFKDPFDFFYWAKDGWYAHCNKFSHIWIGQNWRHCLERINKGYYDSYLEVEYDNISYEPLKK